MQYNAETWKYAIHRSNYSSSYKQRSQGNFIYQKIQNALIRLVFQVTNVRSVKLSGGMIGDVPAGNATVFEIKGRGAVERVNSLIQKYPTLKNAVHVSPDQDAAARLHMNINKEF